MKLPGRRFRIIAAFLAGLTACFWLPFLIGKSDGISESSMYGYSNRVALIVFLVFTAAFVAWTKGLGLTFPDRNKPASGLSWRLLWSTALISTALATAVWLAARPGISFQESPYFLDRYAMHGMGQRLYRDLDFSYGPLMFYLPLAFARITRLSVVDSFYITWILQWFLGVAVLWKVVDLAASGAAQRHRRAVFLLLWAVSVTDVLGGAPNYTPLRYASGLLVALIVWQLFQSRRSALPALGCAALGSVLLLLYSPEQGIALALASVVFFALNWTRDRDFPLASALFLVIVAVALACAASLGELTIVAGVTSGAINTPILPAPQNIGFLLLLIVAASAAWNAIRLRRTNDPLLYFALIAAACLPAAFGHADPNHIFYNLLGAVLVALLVLANSAKTWPATKVSFALVFVLLGALEHAFMDHAAITGPANEWVLASGDRHPRLRRFYVAVMTRAVGPERTGAKLAAPAQAQSPAVSYSLPPGTIVMAPFGATRPAHAEPEDLRVFSGRYPWLLPLLNHRVTEGKIAELQTHPEMPLLIPDVSDGLACRYDLTKLRQRTWQNLFPFYIPPVRHTMTAADPLCDYIRAHYRRLDATSDRQGYEIWVRAHGK